MQIREPHYYHEFHCIASACPDSCCKEWDVQVDPASAAYYRSLPGALGDALRAVLADQEGDTVMLQQNARCPMWQEDGLCRIQAQLGEEALCQVCREFPRLRHDYGDFVEFGLELSCPEAARLILSSPAAPLLSRPVPEEGEAEYDDALMQILLGSRDQALELLRDPAVTPAEALAAVLMYAAAVQAQIDGQGVALCDRAALLTAARQSASPAHVCDILAFYGELEILTESWKKRLASPAAAPDWSNAFRSLAAYGIHRYWLQAVSDYDLLSRAKLIVLSCIVVHALGGDLLQTAQQYSKEIENDIDNVDAILDAAYASPVFSLDCLLGILFAE